MYRSIKIQNLIHLNPLTFVSRTTREQLIGFILTKILQAIPVKLSTVAENYPTIIDHINILESSKAQSWYLYIGCSISQIQIDFGVFST